jgi:hypothetical protein
VIKDNLKNNKNEKIRHKNPDNSIFKPKHAKYKINQTSVIGAPYFLYLAIKNR